MCAGSAARSLQAQKRSCDLGELDNAASMSRQPVRSRGPDS